MTRTQIARVAQTIIETERLLAREIGYSPDLRNAEMVAFYEAHLAKLKGMLVDA